MRAIVEETRADGHRVVRAKGYTDYAVAMSAALVEKRYLCRPGSLPCRPLAAYSRRVRGCLYEGPRLVSCDRSMQTEYRRIHQSGSCRLDRTARVGLIDRSQLTSFGVVGPKHSTWVSSVSGNGGRGWSADLAPSDSPRHDT
jgi:hypothetical protein